MKIKRWQFRQQKIGEAYKKFIELVEKQYGDTSYLENIPKAKYIEEVKAEKSGYISKLDAEICRKSIN